MLSVHSLSKSYGIHTVLTNITFNLNTGEKAALVGPNGCGKTTLLRILAGKEKADSGSFHFNPPDLKPGYLPQGAALPGGLTLGETLTRMQGDLPGLTRRLEELSSALAVSPDHASMQQEYNDCLASIELASESAGNAPAILAGFGLDHLPPEVPVGALSGGQKTRLQLAGLLLANPRVLLLDEPTNHLDQEMLEWLENWLRRSPCAVLMVSHDRAFLENTAVDIYEIDPASHTLKVYPGNYSAYLEQKASERERAQQEYSDQQDEIARLTQTAHRIRGNAHFRKGGKADTGDKFARGFFANRSLETLRRSKAIEARVERLLNEDHIEKPRNSWHMKMEFDATPETGRDVIVLSDLTIGYDAVPLLSEVDAVLRFGQRAVLTGPNGCGKTTLLRTITGQIPALAGRVRLGSGVRAGYMAQEQEDLGADANALESLQRVSGWNETETRTFLHKYLFTGDEVFTPMNALSFGQRTRLSLARLVAQGCNLLLLDEPLNHLDLASRGQFEQALSAFKGTMLVVTHDRYFIQRYATHLWQISRGKLSIEENQKIDQEKNDE